MISPASEQFGLMVCHGRVREYISWAEEGLDLLQESPYYIAKGLSFETQAEDAALHLISFHEAASEKLAVRALYCEMNGFEINPRQWYFDAFAYDRAGDNWDTEWLVDWNHVSPEPFVLRGMESVQQVFADNYLQENKPLSQCIAEDVVLHLVCARFIDLVDRAHAIAKEKYRPLDGLPILATAHDWDSLALTH